MSNLKVNGTALITGSSSGIGAVYADRLAKRGYDLIVVARNQKRLNALADRLKSETGRSVEVVVADLNQKPDLAKVESTLRKDTRVTLLVNNAGVGSVAPLLDADIEKKWRRYDRAKYYRFNAADLRCRSRLRWARRRHDHQYRIGSWESLRRCLTAFMVELRPM